LSTFFPYPSLIPLRHGPETSRLKHDGEKDIKTVADFSGAGGARANDAGYGEDDEEEDENVQETVPSAISGTSKRQRWMRSWEEQTSQ
jgi:hypothetical protein